MVLLADFFQNIAQPGSIAADVSPDHGTAYNFSLGIHEIGGGESIERKLVLQSFPGNDIGVGYACVRDDFLSFVNDSSVVFSCGVAQNGKAELKPYKNITDILSVRGMTVERYSHLCALITTRSDQFRVRILAEALNDVNRDGEYDESKGDYITSYTSQDVIVDRQALMDGEIGESSFRFLSKQQ